MNAKGCRLYIITPEIFDLRSFPDALARALDAGDVAAVQLRLKDAADDVWARAIDPLRPICQSRGVLFLLNDRADLVASNGCDGVHVGQTDMPAREARRLMGSDRALGVTCKSSLELAERAVQDGADYVAFGAFFSSTSKQVTNVADPEVLRRWSGRKTPSCAIGGITAANLAPLVRAGANLLAVIGGVWSHADGPAAGVRAIEAAIKVARG
ncbi:MAG TPA: thiamine phosphate synthase [Candidatus Methylomirabilis sp.]|nr:thiamine phosphate synthase [Candidatus Methylomirabilis sp.]